MKGYVPSNEGLVADLEEMVRIYKEYYDKLYQSHEVELNHAPTFEADEIIIADEITRISKYIISKGFTFEKGLIENFYLNLKTKPFVILAGISGTGKTKLVKLFAESLGATRDNGQYMLVPVRPDWSDSTDLFGHVDLNGSFVPGSIIDFISDAAMNLNKPYFLCLDEMNLARVEYYFSDFLSIIETRRSEGDFIISDPLVNEGIIGHSQNGQRYKKLIFSENLYVVGTVNMDETTYPFSKKVLDRANTIELSHVDLDQINGVNRGSVTRTLPNSFLKSEQLLLNDIAGYDETIRSTICKRSIQMHRFSPQSAQIFT